MANPDGTITTRSNPVHLESLHPSVRVPISSYLDPAISGSNLSVQFGDSSSLDAFGRLRVSNSVGLFDSQLQYDLHRILWENKITNTSGSASVTHDADSSSAIMSVNANDTIVRQTRQYFRYQPGKSQKETITFVFGSSDANVTKRAGYFDDDNGVFIEDDGGTISAGLRSSTSGSPVDSAVDRSSWNKDKLNGNGPSGINLDMSKVQIFGLDLQWLAAGRVRVGFDIGGELIVCHEFNHANIIDNVYMTTANLPARYEISASAGLSGSHTMQAICTEISSEGGFDIARGIPFSATNGRTTRSVGTSEIPLVSIRPKATFNSIVNRGLIVPEISSVYSASQPALLKLVYGGTLTNASFGSVNADSIVDFDVAATAISGGITIASDYVAASNQSKGSGLLAIASQLPITLDIDGNHPTSPYTDSFSLVAVSMVAQSTDMSGTISWREVR